MAEAISTDPFAMIATLSSRLSAKSSAVADIQLRLTSGTEKLPDEVKADLQKEMAALNFQIGIIKEGLEVWKGVLEFFQKAVGKLFNDLASPR